HARCAPHVTQCIGVEPDGRDTQLTEPAGHGSILAGVVQDDEIRPAGEYRLDAGLDAIAQIGDGLCRRGVVAVAASAHHSRISADGKEQLGGGGNERDDPTSGRGETESVTRIVDQLDRTALRRNSAAGESYP